MNYNSKNGNNNNSMWICRSSKEDRYPPQRRQKYDKCCTTRNLDHVGWQSIKSQ